jgi:hypothetical protein
MATDMPDYVKVFSFCATQLDSLDEDTRARVVYALEALFCDQDEDED